MTSTNMFQGFDSGSKPSSRVLRPPGGGSSNLFGGYEEEVPQSRRPNKMASNVFASPEEPQSAPRRSNPPGGKSSGIFGEPEPPVQPQRPLPPGGPSSNIFGSGDSADVHSQSHPNKPKDNISVGSVPKSPATEIKVSSPEVKVIKPEVKEQIGSPAVVLAEEEPTAPPAAAAAPPPAAAPPAAPEPTSSSSSPPPPHDMKNYEPHLGPKPRSHNRVLNPPGGKSSVVFY
ncbi:jupiter microtubule associated homolog 2 [Phycodurus eques]|uniref:jupiter microtubule associated homolog 2 n=1 Tax=Phycodurus eques TaxID=693459 RepID=UPI002ACD6229|nr:jupiter microtubule associated homolog 2 [Phycodurus eques]